MRVRKASLNEYMCDFCGKHQDFVKYIIAGDFVDICDECVAICANIIKTQEEKKRSGVAEASEPNVPKSSGGDTG